MPHPTILATTAQAVAWIWRCPECQARVAIFGTRGGLEPRDACQHFILARASGEQMNVEYAREVEEPETVRRMPKLA